MPDGATAGYRWEDARWLRLNQWTKGVWTMIHAMKKMMFGAIVVAGVLMGTGQARGQYATGGHYEQQPVQVVAVPGHYENRWVEGGGYWTRDHHNHKVYVGSSGHYE